MDQLKQQMVIVKLNALASLRQDIADLETDLQEKTRSVIPQDVLEQIEAIHAEYEPIIESARTRAAQLETDAKKYTESLGETIKADGLMAVYSAPRDLWDSKSLDGFAVAHPEILAFRSKSKPSVSIRTVKK